MNARYLFEHQFLPQCLFSEDHRDRFLLNLLNGKEDFLLRALNNLSKKTNGDCPYSKDDISVHPILHEGKEGRPDLYIIAIKMPEPRSFSECSSVFICFDKEGKKYKYFTKELSFDSDFMLCSWTDDGHSNYGETPDGNNVLFDMISRIFFNEQP